MPILVILFLVAVVFGRSLTGEFLSWDDAQHITLNPWLQTGDWTHFWEREYYGFYIPVAYTIWTWLYKIWPSPMAFHTLNVVLHFLNSAMVYFLAHKILASSNMRGLDERAKDHTPYALFTAAIFAIHPLQVETVAWISAGRDLMASFFGLAAVLAAWNTSDRLFPTWSATIRRGFATILFVLGLLCKPGIVVLPLAIRWLSWFSERRGLKPLMMGFWIMLALVVAGLTSQLQQKFVATRIPHVSILERPLVAADAVFHYLNKYFFPFNLSADYGRTPAVAFDQKMYWALLGVIIVFAIVLALFRTGHRKPPRAFWGSLGFFLIMMSPVLGFVGFSAQAISTVFDRYMYLPSVGISLAIAAVFTTAKIPKPQIRYGAALVFAVICTLLALLRVPVWKSDRSLHEDMYAKNPRSYQAMVNLAIASLKENNVPGAVEWFTKAKDSDPKNAVAWANLSHMYWVRSEPEKIRSEIYPLLQNPEFIEHNKFEPQALSLMWRMWARVNWQQKNIEEARISFCNARGYNAFDKDLADETAAFRKENPNLPECATGKN